MCEKKWDELLSASEEGPCSIAIVVIIIIIIIVNIIINIIFIAWV
jgi:hypothetical protein